MALADSSVDVRTFAAAATVVIATTGLGEVLSGYLARYAILDGNSLHGDYVREVTNRPELKEDTLFQYKVG